MQQEPSCVPKLRHERAIKLEMSERLIKLLARERERESKIKDSYNVAEFRYRARASSNLKYYHAIYAQCAWAFCTRR